MKLNGDEVSNDSPSVSPASPDSDELAAVQRLWRAHSDSLGFFPDGAFQQHAERGWILVAKGSTGDVLGYLVYRIARARAVVVHLCTDTQHRGRGITRLLIREFRARTSDLFGARLTCRLDFAASGVWSRLGFALVSHRPAREPGKTLGVWYMNYGHPDLFSQAADDVAVAVIDANVFYDLATDDESHAEAHRLAQARALRADWFQTTFALAVTPELHTEISRNTDEAEQRRLHGLAGAFIEVRTEPAKVDDALKSVEALLGPGRSESDRSDRRQLAHAIASGSALFLTYDRELLDKTEEFDDQFGLRILEPIELINDIDATEQPTAYAPARIQGSGLTSRRMRADELEVVKQQFLYFAQSESLAGLPSVLREMLAQPHTSRVHVVTNANGTLMAVLGIDSMSGQGHRIRALRVRSGAISHTLARHLLWQAINNAVIAGAQHIDFDDPFSDHRVKDALIATGFIYDGQHWTKLVSKHAVAREELVSHVHAIIERNVLTDTLKSDLLEAAKATAQGEASDVARLERLLWPFKIKVDEIPCYIVPIRPAYAAALFDTTMAAESLFDADVDLLLRLENVYYRSSRPALHAPSRVLWYVSTKGQGYSHAGYISAASTITSISVGTPKALYSKFRRYGVYTYNDVKRIGDSAMAFTFSQTEVLPFPVSFQRVGEILKRHRGVANPLAGPVRVPMAVWFDLYAMGVEDRA